MDLNEIKVWAEKTSRRVVGDPAIQEDIAQEMLIKAWQEIQGGCTEPGLVRYRAYLRAMDLLSGNRSYSGAVSRRVSPAKTYPLPDDFEIPVYDEVPERDPQVWEALLGLPPKTRSYVFARFWMNLPREMLRDMYGRNCARLWTGWNTTGARDKIKEKLVA